MSAIRMPAFGDRPFAESLARIPQTMRKNFREGNSVIRRMSEQQREAIVQRSLTGLEDVGSVGPVGLTEAVGLSEADAESAVGAMMFLMSALLAEAPRKPPEELVAEMVKASLIEPSDQGILTEWVVSLRNRVEEFQLRVERGRLAAHILPTFRTLSAAVDVRFETEGKRIAIPVALLRIFTDEEDQFKFQVTSRQLERMITALRDLQDELKGLEKVARTWEGSKE
jgi:hypothetical protein